jgi:hypothetical protein
MTLSFSLSLSLTTSDILLLSFSSVIITSATNDAISGTRSSGTTVVATIASDVP